MVIPHRVRCMNITVHHIEVVNWGFIFRGLITLVFGIATFFMMPPSPTQTKTWFRPNGWFTEREEIIIVNRILRDDPTKVRCLFFGLRIQIPLIDDFVL